MKRKRYTEDLEFRISDEEADDADAAGRDSPSNTSQSEQQVGSRAGVDRKRCVASEQSVPRQEWTSSGGNSFSSVLKIPAHSNSFFMQGYDMQFDTIFGELMVSAEEEFQLESQALDLPLGAQRCKRTIINR